MAYLKIIESTGSWVCPKDATYKVICVAGGCNDIGELGGCTSFGNYITAEGTIGGTTSGNGSMCGYTTGYTLTDYARYCSEIRTSAPIGYGGGGGRNNGTNVYYGPPGKLTVGFFEVKKGSTVNCIIGNGATPSTGNGSDTFSGNPGVIVIIEVGPITE